MKLKVGESYRCRDGSGPVKITMNHNIGKWRFVGSNGFSYREDGRYLSLLKEYGEDLVAKWDEPEAKPTKNDKPAWYWGFWEDNFKALRNASFDNREQVNSDRILAWANYADAACAERMKREK